MEYMDSVFKGILTLALSSIPWLLTRIYVTTERRKKMSKQDFEFIAPLFDNGALKPLHDVQLSVAFTGLTGQQTEARVIRLLLEQDESFGLVKDYGKGKQFLEPVPESGDLKKLRLNQKSQKMWKCLPREGAYSFFYILTAFIAFAPLIFVSGLAQWLGGNLVGWLSLTGLTMFSFGFISVANLVQYASLKAAQRVDKTFTEKDKITSTKGSKTE